mgnify:CR=1 FL=1
MENRDLRRAAGTEQLRWPAPKRAAFEARAPGVAQARKPATRGFRGLTFEVTRGRRVGARPARTKMYHTASRAWCQAVGPRVDRGVRPRVGWPGAARVRRGGRWLRTSSMMRGAATASGTARREPNAPIVGFSTGAAQCEGLATLDNETKVRVRTALPLPAPALNVPHALSPRWRRTPQSMSGGAVKAVAHGKLEAWAKKFKRAWSNCYGSIACGALPRPKATLNKQPIATSRRRASI